MSTLFMFWLYAAPAVRMSALQPLRWIGHATHDAIGIGEDGPTHQPIALAAFYRALPWINLIRPADAEEVVGAWLMALSDNLPNLFVLSRQGVPLLEGSDRAAVAKGANIVHGGNETPDITLVATRRRNLPIHRSRKTPVKESLQSPRRLHAFDETFRPPTGILPRPPNHHLPGRRHRGMGIVRVGKVGPCGMPHAYIREWCAPGSAL